MSTQWDVVQMREQPTLLRNSSHLEEGTDGGGGLRVLALELTPSEQMEALEIITFSVIRWRQFHRRKQAEHRAAAARANGQS